MRALLVFCLFAGSLPAADLAPTGTLRAAFLSSNPVQGKADPKTGEITGPVADLVRELAGRLKVPYKLLPLADAREVMDRVKDRSADIGFLAWDAPRAKEVDYTVPYLLMLNAYVVRPDSPIQKSADVDRPGVRIGAVTAQTQEIYLTDTLKNAKVVQFKTQPPQAELEQLLVSGQIDAFAMNRQRAGDFARQSSKIRALPDDFLKAEQSIVVAKGESARVAEINLFLRDVLASGFMRASLGRAKIAGVEAAPVPALSAGGQAKGK
jgi:polar amino acid transport system substrate-binding protein